MKTTAFASLLAFFSMTNSSSKSHDIYSEILIKATPQQVWNVLSDNRKWGEWTSFFKSSEGELVVGKRLKNAMVMNGKTYTFRPKVLEVVEMKTFSWKGSFIIPGIFDGTHVFVIQEAGGGMVRVIQKESFRGILKGMIKGKMGQETLKNFNQMNQDLKVKVESMNQ
ncbi:MAG: SRPBCC domain-containing protein [Bacteroidia bacterium]|nr:SRPBCC domain-containing protein [Bacteroidia bacterium]